MTVGTDCELPYPWEDLRCSPIRREPLVALARRFELVRLERLAGELGVGEADAGSAAPSRGPERRLTAEAPGVKLDDRRAGDEAPRLETWAPGSRRW